MLLQQVLRIPAAELMCLPPNMPYAEWALRIPNPVAYVPQRPRYEARMALPDRRLSSHLAQQWCGVAGATGELRLASCAACSLQAPTLEAHGVRNQGLWDRVQNLRARRLGYAMLADGLEADLRRTAKQFDLWPLDPEYQFGAVAMVAGDHAFEYTSPLPPRVQVSFRLQPAAESNCALA